MGANVGAIAKMNSGNPESSGSGPKRRGTEARDAALVEKSIPKQFNS